MPFGEIFTGTFSQIWRHKRLWLFGMLGLALTSIGLLVYQVFQYRWQREWFATMGDLMQNPGQLPDRYFGTMMSMMVWVWVGMGIWMVVGLLGYILNLVMRGATMNEAAVAWRGGRTKTGRGISAGAGRAVYVFLIDLLWLLPGLLLGCGGAGAFIAFIVAAVSAGSNDEAIGAILLTLFAGLCCVFCLVLFVGLLSAVFAPLMYQSAVAGRRGLGAAIGEGWRLAQANLGSMVIFAILLWVLNIALGILAFVLSVPFALPSLSSWMRDWSGVMEAASRGVPPSMPQFGGSGWLLVATFVSVTFTWLASSFMQSFRLTLYAGVYRHLGGQGVPVDLGPRVPAGAPSPSLLPAVAGAGNPDADAQTPAGLPEIMVPDEVTEPVEAPVEVTMPHV